MTLSELVYRRDLAKRLYFRAFGVSGGGWSYEAIRHYVSLVNKYEALMFSHPEWKKKYGDCPYC